MSMITITPVRYGPSTFNGFGATSPIRQRYWASGKPAFSRQRRTARNWRRLPARRSIVAQSRAMTRSYDRSRRAKAERQIIEARARAAAAVRTGADAVRMRWMQERRAELAAREDQIARRRPGRLITPTPAPRGTAPLIDARKFLRRPERLITPTPAPNRTRWPEVIERMQITSPSPSPTARERLIRQKLGTQGLYY